jgi:hypothetical protein
MNTTKWIEIDEEEMFLDESYEYKEVEEEVNDCYESIRLLNKYGLKQTNIHVLVSQETESHVWETFHDYLDGKIPGLNAIVLLGLKKKGRGKGFKTLSRAAYSDIINFALNNNIPIGADSCSGPKLINAVKDRPNFQEIYEMVDPCESTRMSIYVDEKCVTWPCSFSPGADGWKKGIDMLAVKDFEKEVWQSDKFNQFRESLANSKDCNGCENCPLYDI